MAKKTIAHCNTCGPGRNHEVLFEERTSWSDDDYGIWGNDRYEFLKCAGCDSVKVRHSNVFSENDPEHPTVSYFPPASFRAQPDWIGDLVSVGTEGSAIYQLLVEIYSAVQNDLRGLAAMGVRALLEHVMVSVSGDSGSFVKNLEKFQSDGHVSANQRARLETTLEAGHASIHRGFTPSLEDVTVLVDIAESVLVDVFIHPKKIELLKNRIPKRVDQKAKRPT